VRSEVRYHPSVELWPAQKTAVELLEEHDNFALLMAMRTGKSAPILTDFGQRELRQECRDILIIAPAGVYKTWLANINLYASADLKKRLTTLVWQSGTTTQTQVAKFLGTSGPRCLLVNVEALSLASSQARPLCEKFLHQRDAIAVIDESTVIKNPKAKRTKYILRTLAPLARYRRILSGLPTPRNPLDLYCQFAFLDKSILGQPNYQGFEREHAIIKRDFWGGRWVEHVVGFLPGTEDKLRRMTAPHSYRVEFRPKVPSSYSIREVSLTPEQKQHYAAMRDFATTKLADESHVTATVVIAQIMKMHQILCGWVRDENGDVKSVPERRTSALLEELEDYPGKAIVWFSYVENLDRAAAAIQEEYGIGSLAKFYGDNASTREADEERFKSDPHCRFMLATAGAGGMGRTWSNADRVVYFSSTNNLEHREQSEQRSLGVQKDRGVDYVDLIAPDTVDMKILKALREKINMASAINGDNYREWIV